MSIILVTPSNTLFMPYLTMYRLILDRLHVSYDIIVWNRLQMKENVRYVYTDRKYGDERGTIDYLLYSRFIKKILKTTHYDGVIIFGVELLYYMSSYLVKNYHNRFFVDIRDFHPLIKQIDHYSVAKATVGVAISSRAFLDWLPEKYDFVVSHNTIFESEMPIQSIDFGESGVITIGYIGSFRDKQIHFNFMKQMKNDKRFILNYYGEGINNDNVMTYLEENQIQNVFVGGRYLKNDEIPLYQNNDLINLLRDESTTLSRSSLPNRLYNAVYVGKPLLVFGGTYLSGVVAHHNIGLVINTLEGVAEKILTYIDLFDEEKFNQGRKDFFKLVVADNQMFIKEVEGFVSKKN